MPTSDADTGALARTAAKTRRRRAMTSAKRANAPQKIGKTSG